MGLSISAAGGLGYVIDTSKIENEDHAEAIRDLYLRDEDVGVISAVVGFWEDDHYIFIGFGSENSMRQGISSTPTRVLTDDTTIEQVRATVDRVIDAIVLTEDGPAGELRQYITQPFGLHVYAYANN